eukprot:TCONS_00005235-protein
MKKEEKVICLSLLLISGSLSSNIIRLTKWNQANFRMEGKNKKHPSSPYKNINVESVERCLDQCTYEGSCKAANVDTNKTPLECQLLSHDQNDNNQYIDASGFYYYDTGITQLSTLRAVQYSSSCFVPNTFSCDVVDGSKLVQSSTNCGELFAYFSFDAEQGTIFHHCSALPVCFASTSAGSEMILSTTNCLLRSKDGTGASYKRTFRRDFRQYLMYNAGCIQLSSNSGSDGNTLIISDNCMSGPDADKQIYFPELESKKKIWTTYCSGVPANFDDFLTHNFGGCYTSSGYADDFLMMSSYEVPSTHFSIRMQSWFIPEHTGYYRFGAACKLRCVVYCGTSESTKQMVLRDDDTSWPGGALMVT